MKRKKWNYFFDRFASRTTKLTGTSFTFMIALSIIIIWGLTGPLFKFSDTWQLVINTGTTIITFLMVFIIQQTQNKDTMAIHLKLNELISATKNASNRLIDIEDLTEEELEVIKKFYINLALLARKDMNVHKTHSVEEAHNVHHSKLTVSKK